MTVIFSVINLILTTLALVSVVWTFVGIPLGIFFIYKYFTTKNKAYKKILPRKIILSFLGLVISALLPVLWVVIDLLSNIFLGANVLLK